MGQALDKYDVCILRPRSSNMLSEALTLFGKEMERLSVSSLRLTWSIGRSKPESPYCRSSCQSAFGATKKFRRCQ